MFTVKVDPHTHTFFSGHAYSTIEENAIHAAQKGMEAIGMTDHFSPLFSQGGELFRDFGSMLNMKALPKVIHGVRVLSGVEIDIVDFDGHLAAYDSYISQDIQISACEKLLSTREIAIASVHHFNGSRSGSILQNTHMYINVLRNPGIDIIGHCGRAGLPFEIDEVLKVANEEGKMIEINEHSFDFGEPIIGVCRRIALRCAELGVPIVVSSDAHSAFYVGDFKKALAMLDEIEFPEGLVANLTLEKLLATIEKRKRRANVIQPIQAEKLRQYIIGWINYFKTADIKSLLGRVDEWMRRRIRMIYWKQWKKVKTRFTELKRLEIKKNKAWEYANIRKGYRRISNSPILSMSLDNQILASRGYLFFSDYYRKVCVN